MTEKEKSDDLTYVLLGSLLTTLVVILLEVIIIYSFEVWQLFPVKNFTLPFFTDKSWFYNVYSISLVIIYKRGYLVFLLIVIFGYTAEKFELDFWLKYLISFILLFVNYGVIINNFTEGFIPLKEAVAISALCSFVVPYLMKKAETFRVFDNSRQEQD